MSIDFSTLQGLTIPEGVVTQITDASGNVLWAVQSSKTVVLEVEKITSDTYAGETTYTGEQFILLDIYPKTNGTVSVTYGGLTKTITDISGAEEPNAQQVFFGTFNGVSDSVTTPASGELTIEGDYVAFGIGSYAASSKISNGRCPCVTAVIEYGEVAYIPDSAFMNCDGLTSVTIPDSVTSIGKSAFYQCDGLTSVTIPDSVTSIGNDAFGSCKGLTSIVVDSKNQHYYSDGVALFNKDKTILFQCGGGFSGHYTIPDSVTSIDGSAFSSCDGLTSVTIPDSVTSIGKSAFMNCDGLTSVTIPDSVTSIGKSAFYQCTGLTSVTFNNTNGWYSTTTENATSGTSKTVTDASKNAATLKGDYSNYWYRSA